MISMCMCCLYLQDGRQLRYHDTRKFGKMYLYEKRKDIHQYPCFQNIGLDAFDERLTPTYLYHALHKRKMRIKSCSTGSKRILQELVIFMLMKFALH